MKALSVKQPFANWLVEGIKNAEHRTRDTYFRGRIAIHASLIEDKEFMEEYGLVKWKFVRGAIVGTVEIFDTIKYSNNSYAWKVRHPVKFQNPVPCKGSLSIWQVTKEVEEMME